MVILAWMFWTLALWADMWSYRWRAGYWSLCHAQSYPTTEEGTQAFKRGRTHRFLTRWPKLEVSPVVLAFWMWRCYHVTLQKGREHDV